MKLGMRFVSRLAYIVIIIAAIILAIWANAIFSNRGENAFQIEIGDLSRATTLISTGHGDPNDRPILPVHTTNFNSNLHRNFAVFPVTFTWSEAANSTLDVDLAGASLDFIISIDGLSFIESATNTSNQATLTDTSNHLIELRILQKVDGVNDIDVSQVEAEIGSVNSIVSIDAALATLTNLTLVEPVSKPNWNGDYVDGNFDFTLDFGQSITYYFVLFISENTTPADMDNIVGRAIEIAITRHIGANEQNIRPA